MIMSQNYIGVDVSKDRLDIFETATAKSSVLAMTAERTLKAFARRAARDHALVVFEATGGYDRPLADALRDAGADYTRVNPRRARHFARATRRLAKTDRVDACMLAHMGEALGLKPDRPPEPERQRLSALLTRRDQLVEFCKQEKTRLHQAGETDIQTSITTVIAGLEERISDIEKAIADLMAQYPSLQQTEHRLRTMPGVGQICAATLVAQLPELGSLDRRSIAALAGLAPIARDSGQTVGRRSIGGGRRQVRRLLYLAALYAGNNVPEFQDFRQRLLDRGKTKKQAAIAVARKLVVILNAMLREGKDFEAATT